MLLPVEEAEPRRYILQAWTYFRLPTGCSTASLRLQLQRHSITMFVAVSALIFISACGNLAGPEYQRPAAVEKVTWSDSGAVDVSAPDTIRLDWWSNFNDPYLNELMQQALAKNADLRVLAARVGVAEAVIGQANAARLPTIDSALGANYLKSEGRDSNRSVSQATALGWEADIWGKLKKGVQAQKAGLKATEADWRAGYLSLAANVSQTYFQIRTFDEQIDQQQSALASTGNILSIYEAQHKEGLIPKIQVLQQQAELGRLRNDLLELKRLRRLAENALSTLLGIPAGDKDVPKQHLIDTVDAVTVPAGLPADLLSRRPDIIAAEYRVLEAHELLGQARLAKLPTISLTANAGNTSAALSDLVKTFTFGLTPTFSLPIFDPNVHARIHVSEAQTNVSEEEYRRTVIRAFEEVENALVNLSSRRAQQDELIGQRDKLRIVNTQIQAQLAEGMVTQLQVFESERSLLAAELRLLDNHQQFLSDTVTLYSALGGGWPKEIVGGKAQ